MDIQLQLLKTNKYIFVSDATKKRKGFQVKLEHVEFRRYSNMPKSDGYNKKIKTEILSHEAFTIRWNAMKDTGWRIVGID